VSHPSQPPLSSKTSEGTPVAPPAAPFGAALFGVAVFVFIGTFLFSLSGPRERTVCGFGASSLLALGGVVHGVRVAVARRGWPTLGEGLALALNLGMAAFASLWAYLVQDWR
jgi:hypothetical protein